MLFDLRKPEVEVVQRQIPKTYAAALTEAVNQATPAELAEAVSCQDSDERRLLDSFSASMITAS